MRDSLVTSGTWVLAEFQEPHPSGKQQRQVRARALLVQRDPITRAARTGCAAWLSRTRSRVRRANAQPVRAPGAALKRSQQVAGLSATGACREIDDERCSGATRLLAARMKLLLGLSHEDHR